MVKILNGKILAAVFTVLTAVAVVSSGGASEDIDAEPPEFDTDRDGFSSGGILDRIRNYFSSQPEPENNFTANLTVEDLSGKPIEVNSADIYSPEIYSLQLSNQEVSSDNLIQIEGFNGRVSPGQNSSIDGTAANITTTGVNITGSSNIGHTQELEEIYIYETEKMDLTYSNVTGRIDADTVSTDIDEKREIEIKSFSGNIQILPDTDRLILEGKVYSVTSGEFEFGG